MIRRTSPMAAPLACRLATALLALAALVDLAPTKLFAQEAAAGPAAKQPAASLLGDEEDEPRVLEPPKLPDPEGAKALPKPDRVWIDAKRHQVLVDGYVALREGYLEMFACTVGTKEHESIVAVQTRAATVHAALLAVGAVPGHPVKYRPKFEPASGMEIDVEVRWLDDAGKWKSARAQDWIKDLRTKKPMAEHWVFAGSGFWTEEESGKRHYMAEAGDFICVSNFTTAMLDLPIESSQSNDGLLFGVMPDVVPALGTPVRLVLMPKLDEKKAGKPVGKAIPAPANPTGNARSAPAK